MEKDSHAAYLPAVRRGSRAWMCSNYISHEASEPPAFDDGRSGSPKQEPGRSRKRKNRPPRSLYRRPGAAGRRGQDRPPHRTCAGAAAHHAGALPPAQEQPDLCGRARRRQDRHGRGAGQRIFEGRGPRPAQRDVGSTAWIWAGCWPAPNSAGDFEQRLKGVIAELQKRQERHSLHRRDSHDRRRRRHQQRLHGCLQHSQTGAGQPGSCAASAPPPTKSTRTTSRRTAPCRGALKKSRSPNRRSTKPSRSCEGLKRASTRSTTAFVYTDAALKAAADLSAKYINDRFLPDKAIDVIDEAGAFIRLARRPQPQQDPSRRYRKNRRQDGADPHRAASRLPTRASWKTWKTRLKQVVFGQDDAITLPGDGHQAVAGRAGHPGKAGRLLSVHRPHRRRQDRGGAPGGRQAGGALHALST